MEAAPCESATDRPTRPRNRGVNKALFIASLLNRKTHNNRAYRTGSELLPGERARHWRAGDLAHYGYAALLRIYVRRVKATCTSKAAFSRHCSTKDAEAAASNGHLEVV